MWRSFTSWVGYLIVGAVVIGAAWLLGTHATGRLVPDSAFSITAFDARFELEPQPNGRLDVLVTERITTEFTARDRRGIIRTIPLRYQDHANTITDITVTGRVSTTSTRTEHTPRHTVERDTGAVAIRIGSSSEILRTGEQYYEIRYRLTDIALNTPDGSAQEVALDINGTDWAVPTRQVTGRIVVPAELTDRMTGDLACYVGESGATTVCPIAVSGSDPVTVSSDAARLGAFQGVTMAVGFEPGTFAQAYTPHREIPWYLGAGPAVGLIMLGIAWVQTWRTRAVGKRVLVTEYQPPEGVSPVVAADIWGRPERGPLAQLLGHVVAGTVSLQFDRRRAAEAAQAGPPETLSRRERRRLRSDLTISGLGELGGTDGDDIVKAYFSHGLSPTPWRDVGGLARRRQDIMVANGWRRPAPAEPTVLGRFLLVVLAAGAAALYAAYTRGAPWWWGMLAGALGILTMVASVYRTPTAGPLTEKGRAAHHHLRGLHEFVTMAEAGRISWLQGVATAPRVTQDSTARLHLYEKLLPYAVIFGVEDSWAQLLGEQHDRPDLRVTLGGEGLTWSVAQLVRVADAPDLYRADRFDSGVRRFTSANHSVSNGLDSIGQALRSTGSSSNSGGGRSSGWSSGSSRGGGSSGSGMGGGGGRSW